MIKIKKISLICIVLVVLTLAGCYSVYIDSVSEEIEPVVFDVGAALLGSRFNQTPQLRQPTPEEAERYIQPTNLPALHITLEHTPLRQINRDEYVPGSYTFIFGDEGGFFNEPLTIKGRGAWSWSHPKRPYTVELFRETSWGGLPAATKWVMIGNWSDKSLLRNSITLQFAQWVSDDWAPATFFADVFVNGEYQGTYLITESIEIHENRLNLDRATEAIFEIEGTFRHHDHSDCIEMLDGRNHIMFKRPRGALMPEARAQNLEKFREFFRLMQGSLSLGYEAYSQFINVPSFVNWYIINEFTKNFDSAFTASCYAFIQNGILHMGPAWDFDTCFGNQNIGPPMNKTDPAGFHVSTSPWFRRLMNDETFHRLVQERWTELRQNGVLDDFVQLIDDTAAHIAESARLNFEVWPCALAFTMRYRHQGATFTHEDEVEYLRNWIPARIAWLDTQWYIG